MYHPGIVMSVISHNDKNVLSGFDNAQALVEMWDKHVLTFDVADKIKDQIRKDDMVLVDYTPKEDSHVPKHIIVKIIRGKQREEIWDKYSEYFRKQKMKSEKQQHTYFG